MTLTARQQRAAIAAERAGMRWHVDDVPWWCPQVTADDVAAAVAAGELRPDPDDGGLEAQDVRRWLEERVLSGRLVVSRAVPRQRDTSRREATLAAATERHRAAGRIPTQEAEAIIGRSRHTLTGFRERLAPIEERISGRLYRFWPLDRIRELAAELGAP